MPAPAFALAPYIPRRSLITKIDDFIAEIARRADAMAQPISNANNNMASFEALVASTINVPPSTVDDATVTRLIRELQIAARELRDLVGAGRWQLDATGLPSYSSTLSEARSEIIALSDRIQVLEQALMQPIDKRASALKPFQPDAVPGGEGGTAPPTTPPTTTTTAESNTGTVVAVLAAAALAMGGVWYLSQRRTRHPGMNEHVRRITRPQSR